MGVVTDALQGISAVASLVGNYETKQATDQAIELRLKQEEIQNELRTTQRTANLNQVLASQTAAASARGYSTSSPSLFAISAESINQYAQDENADALNLNFDKLNAANQERNALYQEIGGDINTGVDLANTMVNGSFSNTGSQSGMGQFAEEGSQLGESIGASL